MSKRPGPPCRRRHHGHICTLEEGHGLTDTQDDLAEASKAVHECFCGNHRWISPHPFTQHPQMAPGICWCRNVRNEPIHGVPA